MIPLKTYKDANNDRIGLYNWVNRGYAVTHRLVTKHFDTLKEAEEHIDKIMLSSM